MTVRLVKALRDFTAIRDRFNAKVAEGGGDGVGAAINALIMAGTSPVKGFGRYKEYSTSYKAAIKDGQYGGGKKIRPVSLHLTGAMLKSQTARETTRNGRKVVTVGYTDPKAGYHNAGNEKLPRRPLIPSLPGEEFSRAIFEKVFRMAKESIDEILKK